MVSSLLRRWRSICPTPAPVKFNPSFLIFTLPLFLFKVNLDAATREKTRREIESGSPSCFDEAQKMIYNLMEKDSYRRFLKSKMIQEICQKESCTAQEKKGCDWPDSRQVLAGGA